MQLHLNMLLSKHISTVKQKHTSPKTSLALAAPATGPLKGFDLVTSPSFVSGSKLCQRVQPLAAGPSIATIENIPDNSNKLS